MNIKTILQCSIILFLCNTIAIAQGAAQAVILQYHHISSITPAATSLSLESFESQMQALDENGFTVISLPILLKSIKQKQALTDKTVAITFDDGYSSVYETVFPLMKKRNWPFTIFISPKAINEKQSKVLTWEQIREMSDAGVTIANHSYSHDHLIRLLAGESEQQWIDRIVDDINKAETEIVDKTIQHNKILAWPYGEYSETLYERLNTEGYVALAQHSGVVHINSDFLALPRYSFNQAYGDINDFLIKAQSLPLLLSPNIPLPIILDKPVILEIELKLSDASVTNINCYASNQGRVKTVLIDDLLTITLNQTPAIGRSRINCTTPTTSNRFRWYSIPIIRKQLDGSWHKELTINN